MNFLIFSSQRKISDIMIIVKRGDSVKKISFMLIAVCALACQNYNSEFINSSNVYSRGFVKCANNSSYTPLNKFNYYQKYDCGEIRKDGVIGRHAFFKPYSISDRGNMVCAKYTDYVMPKAFGEITLGFKYYKTLTTSISFTYKVAYQAANEINLTAEIPGFVSATKDYKFVKTNEYGTTTTKSYSIEEAVESTYTVSSEAGNSQKKKFAVGKVARVYELRAQYYETHWLFWNHEEIQEDTVKDFIAYIAVNSFLDVIYEDGTYFE